MIRAFKSKRYVVHRDLAWRQRHDLQTYCVAASRLSTLTYYRSSLRGPVQAYAPTLAAGFAPGALFPPGPASTAFCPTQKGRAQERARERRCRRWNGFLGIVQPAYAINRTQGSNVLADVPAFTRKVLLHALAKALNAAAKLKMRPSMTVRSYVSGIVLYQTTPLVGWSNAFHTANRSSCTCRYNAIRHPTHNEGDETNA